MRGLAYMGKALKNFVEQFNEERIYQVTNGNHSRWITIDELIQQNKENIFNQHLLGAKTHETIKRSIRRANGKNEAN